MSRLARITGSMLLAIVIALIVGGWRLYNDAARPSPQSLAEQAIQALNSRSPAHALELIDHGADINGKERYSGRTCLMAAAEIGDVSVIQRLLQRGANLDATDNADTTALVHLFEGGHATPALTKMLLPKSGLRNQKSGNGYSALAAAANTRDPEIVRMLLDSGANANDKGIDGLPLLETAVEADNLAMTKPLVAHGASVNVRSVSGKPMLQTAENLTDDPLAQYLIAHGADINALDDTSNTPLISAVVNNLPGAFGDLLKKGAKIDARNKNKETALIVAAKEVRATMVEALLKRHADPNLRDATLRTAQAWAKEQGFTDIEHALASQPDAR